MENKLNNKYLIFSRKHGRVHCFHFFPCKSKPVKLANWQNEQNQMVKLANWQNEQNETVKLANWQNEQNETVKLANWQNEQNGMVKLANWQNEQNEKCLCRFSNSAHSAGRMKR